MLARRLTGTPSPTVDLYFLNSCGELVGDDGPLRQIAPTVFESAEARLVIRHDVGAPPSEKRVVYFADDALFSGARDASLPLTHRMKLRSADCDAARRLLPRASAVVASTQEVLDDLLGAVGFDAPAHVVNPFWREPMPDLDHFDRDAPPSVAFLGAGTHVAGARFARAVAREIHAGMPEAVIHLSGNHRRFAERRRSYLRYGAPTRWPDYRRSLATTRRHVALYPVPDTPHARARSVNKLIEHALVGAAPIYSQGWPRGRMAAEAGGGLALPDAPGLWAAAALDLLANPARARALAAGAQALALRLQSPQAQRALWTALLGTDAD